MKKNIIYPLASAACAIMALMACKPSPATLTGTITNYRGGYIECTIKTGKSMKADSVDIHEDGTFSYTRDFPEGAEIWLASEDVQGFVRLFLQNGEKQHIIMTASADSVYGRCDVVLSGDAKGSEYLQLFDNEFGSLTKWSTGKAGEYQSFKDYKAAIDSTAEILKAKLEETGNKSFTERELKKIENKRLTLPFRFAQARMNANQPADNDRDFVAYAEGLDYNDPNNAHSNLVDLYIKWYQYCHPDTSLTPGEQYFTILKQRIKSQELIDMIADNYIVTYLDKGADAGLEASFEAYKKTTTHQDQVKELQPLYDKIKKLLPGSPAPDFELNDVQGNPIRFRDIIGKGKVVYLDVWATWCGPCVGEIPFMEKLVKHYAGNPKITFISISLDDKVDRWKKKLEADKPSWKQFIIPDALNSTLCKEYDIPGIPRFMLFDEEGKIINTNAPRPSSDEILYLLDESIK